MHRRHDVGVEGVFECALRIIMFSLAGVSKESPEAGPSSPVLEIAFLNATSGPGDANMIQIRSRSMKLGFKCSLTKKCCATATCELT